jgi:hypothetical protein
VAGYALSGARAALGRSFPQTFFAISHLSPRT